MANYGKFVPDFNGVSGIYTISLDLFLFFLFLKISIELSIVCIFRNISFQSHNTDLNKISQFCLAWGGGIPACLAGGIPAGPHQEGVSRPTPRGVSRSTPGGSPGPQPGGPPAPHLGGGCIPACIEADPPPWMATAAGSTHPTGMHSCLDLL